MAKQRAKTKSAARKVAKPKATKPAAKRSAPAKKAKAFTPFIQATRWPRDISLKKVVKRRDMGDLDGLAKSIDERGCLLQPVVIDAEDSLIAGQRRLAAWPKTKFAKQPIPVHVVDVDAIIAGEWDENAQRKDFTPSESVDMMEALLPIAKAAAKARQAHGKTAPGKGKKAADPEAGEAVDHLARYLGKDRKTLTKAQEVVEAARANPEKFGDLVAVMDKSGKVNGPWNRLRVRRQTDDIKAKRASGKLDLPEGQHDQVVIDYAWPHEPGKETEDRATRPYKTMPIIEGVGLMRELRKRLAKNATVYMWTTSYHMQHAFTLLRAAGLLMPGDAGKDAADPTKGAVCAPTILTWVKDSIGQGQRLREQSEHCIIAIKGDPLWKKDNLPSTVLRGASGENSEKPAEFYALIEELTPAERPLELFARRVLPEGWAGWGDQVGTLKAAPPAIDVSTEDGLLAVLEAIDAGEAVVFERGHKAIDKLVTGAKKPKLTKLGKATLEDLRRWKAERDALAALPSDIEALIADYRATIERRHAAVLAGDEEAAQRELDRLDLLEQRANGGSRLGMGTDESPAERLRRETAAPIGEVPMWGQRGMFRLDIDGTPYLVAVSEDLDFELYAEDRTKPFISESGFQSFMGWPDEVALGVTVAAQVEAYIREEIATPANASGKRKARGKANMMPLPEECYRLPTSWDEAREPISNDEDDKARRSLARLQKRAAEAGHEIVLTINCGGEATTVDAACQCGQWRHSLPWNDANERAIVEQHAAAHLREAMAAAAKPKNVKKSAPKGKARRAAKNGVGEPAKGSASALRHPDFPHGVIGHVITMTRGVKSGDAGDVVVGIATCECGNFRAEHTATKEGYDYIDREVDAHWRAAVDAGAHARHLAPADAADAAGAPA